MTSLYHKTQDELMVCKSKHFVQKLEFALDRAIRYLMDHLLLDTISTFQSFKVVGGSMFPA